MRKAIRMNQYSDEEIFLTLLAASTAILLGAILFRLFRHDGTTVQYPRVLSARQTPAFRPARVMSSYPSVPRENFTPYLNEYGEVVNAHTIHRR